MVDLAARRVEITSATRSDRDQRAAGGHGRRGAERRHGTGPARGWHPTGPGGIVPVKKLWAAGRAVAARFLVRGVNNMAVWSLATCGPPLAAASGSFAPLPA